MKKTEQEFAKIVSEHKDTIYSVCYMFADDAQQADDLFQETLIGLWKGLEGFEGRSDLRTWIYRVSLNTCLTWDRKRKKMGQRVPLSMDINLYEDSSENARQIRQLHERIGRLGVMDRALILLWLDDLSYDEIGAIVGISAKNVSVKLVRIKEKLFKMHDNGNE